MTELKLMMNQKGNRLNRRIVPLTWYLSFRRSVSVGRLKPYLAAGVSVIILHWFIPGITRGEHLILFFVLVILNVTEWTKS